MLWVYQAAWAVGKTTFYSLWCLKDLLIPHSEAKAWPAAPQCVRVWIFLGAGVWQEADVATKPGSALSPCPGEAAP